MDLESIYNRHVETVYRLCLVKMKHLQDAEDVTQQTFLQLIKHPQEFSSTEHEKAWLIVTASNLCKNSLKYWFRSKRSDPELLERLETEDERDEVLELLFTLDKESRELLYLTYYEGYKSDELEKMLGVKASTIRSRLSKARDILKLEMEKDDEERRIK